jgi:hypothetical protein
MTLLKRPKSGRSRSKTVLRRIGILGQTITYNELNQLGKSIELLKAAIGRPKKEK